MEKRLKIGSVITSLVLYCFFISIYCGTVVSSSSAYSHSFAHENFDSAYLSNDASQSEQAENSIRVYHNTPQTSIKNSFNQFSFSCIAANGLLHNLYCSYILYCENLFIRFSKTDIIFPFHNFW